jgi:hypothetical protein
MAKKQLSITPVGNNANAGDPFSIAIDENQAQDAILGILTGFAAGENLAALNFQPNNDLGANGTDGGRFGVKLMTINGQQQWVVYVAKAAAGDFDLEGDNPPLPNRLPRRQAERRRIPGAWYPNRSAGCERGAGRPHLHPSAIPSSRSGRELERPDRERRRSLR